MVVCVVTGANGFIGTNVVHYLSEQGWEVRPFLLEGTHPGLLEQLPCRIFYGDICREQSMKQVMKGAEAVVHLAALARDWGPRELFHRINVTGTRNVLQAALNEGVSRLLFMSSVAVHRYSGHPQSHETAPRDCPVSFHYGRSKIEAEDVVRNFHSQGLLETVIIRPAVFPFGPYDYTSFFKLAHALEKGRFAFVRRGRARLTTVGVDNLSRGIQLALTHPKAAGETFIISDSGIITWRQLIAAFCTHLGIPTPRLSIPFPVAWTLGAATEVAWKVLRLPGEPPITTYRTKLMAHDLVFLSDKAERILGYSPLVSRQDQIRKTVEWYRGAKREAAH